MTDTVTPSAPFDPPQRRRGRDKNLISRVCAAVPYVLDHGNHDQMSPDGRVDVRLSREFSTPVPIYDFPLLRAPRRTGHSERGLIEEVNRIMVSGERVFLLVI